MPVNRPQRKRRRTMLAQSLVEFGLVAPFLFFIIFSAIDGGLLMYAVNSGAQSADVGMVTLADEGTTSTADSDAIANLRAAGLGVTALDSIDEVDIYQLAECRGGIAYASPAIPSANCSGQPDGTLIAAPNTDTVNYNRYCWNGWCTNSGTWTPDKRINSASQGVTNIGLTIRYHFNYLGLNNPSAHLAETRYFRIEPRTE